MRLACILPAHNEEAMLERSVRRVWDWCLSCFRDGGFVIVISENGSTDATARLAQDLAAAVPEVRALTSAAPGKGGAIKRGMTAVEADVYLTMDVDLSTDLHSAGRLVDLIGSHADMAIASRRMPDSAVRRPMLRRFVTAVYAGLADAWLGLGIRDVQCGCKALSRRVRVEIVPRVEDEGFFFDTELLALARSAGLSIAEVGVRWEEPPGPDRQSTVPLVATSADFMRKMVRLKRRLAL